MKDSLQKKKGSRLNKSFGSGVCRQKYVRDYPLLLRYLAHVFCAAHQQIQSGSRVKYGFCGPEIIIAGYEMLGDSADFWQSRLRGYEIANVCASACYSLEQSPSMSHLIALSLSSHEPSDIFVADNYVLMLAGATLNIDVAANGTLRNVELISDERQPPGFLIDLVRDFRLSGPSHREKLRQQIRKIGTLPEEMLFASVRFCDVVTVTV